MIQSPSNEPIQAFPIESSTYVSPAGGMTAFVPKGVCVVKALGDGTITVHFGSVPVAIPVVTGMDFAIHGDCTSIDSDVQVIIS
jgi:hypothetical protein